MMRVSTRTHGIMDLITSATFLAAPLILNALGNTGKGNGRGRKRGGNRNGGGAEKILLPAIGAGILAQGLMTDHELGLSRKMSMKSHLLMDLGLGAFMIAAPRLLNLDNRTNVPLRAIGATVIGLALITNISPGYDVLEDLTGEGETLLEDIAD